jgi:hypothetical protein
MARPKRTAGRISPTHALELLLTETPYPFAAGPIPAIAEWISEALHARACRIWHDGKEVSRAEATHLSVLANCDAAGWYASVKDDRWGVRSEEGYEFDADEIRALLPETAAPERPASAAMQRRRPGKKTTGNWKLEAVIEMRDFVKQKGRRPTAPELCERIDNKLNYYPDESEMRKLMRLLLDE